MKKLKGFSLIELLVVLAIIALLAAIATQVYFSYIRKSRRIDAVNSLLGISLAQERYRSTHTTYGTLAQVWAGVTASSGGYYTLAISSNTATGYTATATATGDQVNDVASGTSCTPMTLSVSSGAVSKTPTACWPT